MRIIIHVTVLREINQNGQTVILVTHNHELASQTNRIVRMEDGLIIDL